MKTEDRRLIIHYLNNILKGPLLPELKEKLWDWAEDCGQEVFRINLERLGDEAAEKIASLELGSRSEERYRAKAAKFRLLKKTAAAAGPVADPGRTGQVCELSEKIADTFRLERAERDVLRLFVGSMSLPALADLMGRVLDSRRYYRDFTRQHFQGLGRFLGRPAGEVERAFRRESPLIINGLFSLNDEGELSASEPLKKMINQPRQAGRDLKSLVLEKKTKAGLTRAHFDHLAEGFEHLAQLLARGLQERERGLNVLLYGPSGTGKTELAKTLAAEIKADLYPVSETSTENRRSARLAELQMARTLVAGDSQAMLLVDEAEDVFGGQSQASGLFGFFNLEPPRDTDGSKLFFNRMLEKNETPVIWITNNIKCLDPAYLRRFSYALEVKTPPAQARARIWRDELARRKVKMTEKEIDRLARNYELPPSYAVSAIRAAKLLRDNGAIERTLDSLDYAVTRKPRPNRAGEKADFNPALLNTDTDLSKLTEQVLNGRELNFSLCLFGAPGTGKSEYVRHLAGRMGLEVLHKRTSDLLSCWVGGSEKNIAAAFQEARAEKKFLIFDEADSLLQDRGQAFRSWEVTQVNEMLTCMESHPYPFACTTNLMDRLDKASLRRFTFKVKYDYLTREQARLAFGHFFGQDHDVKLDALTPGDFAVVARKAAIMGLTDPAKLAEMLAQEQEAKGIKSTVMGFQL